MQGLIFIPDISGYTRFVKNIDINLGASIIQDLLNEIIENNPLDLQLSEIEGDAILYYKEGEPVPVKEIFAAYEQIKTAFDKKFQHLKSLYHLGDNLSIKVIVHYGELTVYNIKGFKSLYGQAVVESHRLLKNGSASTNYVLITEDYLKALEQTSETTYSLPITNTSYSSKQFVDLREIEYYCFEGFPTLSIVPPAAQVLSFC
jgi:hypothetical protein